MKMTKDEIRALKLKHRLELVMQATGEVFEIDSKHPDQWHSKSTPGLTVDISRQIFDIKSPGKADSGDVIAWLRGLYSWTFDQAIRFLRNRPADPKREYLSKATKGRKNKNTSQTAWEVRALDQLQEKALQLGGERIRKYFAWSSWDFILSNEEIRIDPVIAPDIPHCQHCNKRFDWLDLLDQNVDLVPQLFGYRLEHVGPIPIIAYSIKRRLKVDLSRIKQTDIQDAFDELVEAQNGVFVEDDDGIVCTDCASKELKFHLALSLCERSARSRERAEESDACVIGGRGGAHEELL